MEREKVHDLLVKKTAIRTLTPESVVEKIISFQGKDASKYVRSVNQVELSGFGKFMRSQNKTKKKIDSMEKNLERMKNQLLEAAGDEEEAIRKKISHTEECLIYHKTKVNEQVEGVDQADTGGDQES